MVHEKKVYELTIFGMDILSLDLNHWCQPNSKKSAASILFAMMIHWPIKSIEELWTPNLKYYTGFDDAKDLLTTTKVMLETLRKCLSDQDHDFSLTIKYYSVSRHNGLLSKINETDVHVVIQYTEDLLNEIDSAVFY